MPSRAPFPATAWTQVLTAQSEAPESRLALEDICKAYWPAIYTYLRALGCEREEARETDRPSTRPNEHGFIYRQLQSRYCERRARALAC
jgi:hypothetical protein